MVLFSRGCPRIKGEKCLEEWLPIMSTAITTATVITIQPWGVPLPGNTGRQPGYDTQPGGSQVSPESKRSGSWEDDSTYSKDEKTSAG